MHFAVAVYKVEMVDGHVPREISQTCLYILHSVFTFLGGGLSVRSRISFVLIESCNG